MATGSNPRAGRRPTINDVARRAEVSPAAVSKVLRDAYGVSPAMRQRVSAAVADLGYRPMLSARSMRTGTRTLGISSLNPRNPFLPMLLDGVAQESGRRGYSSFITLTELDGASQLQSALSMVDRQMDGVILITPTMGPADLELLAAEVPVVVVGLHGTGGSYDSVASDDALGSELMVDHLVARGHRRILFHTQPTRVPGLPEEHRVAGFRSAVARHGVEGEVVEGAWTTEGGAALAASVVARHDPPTAVHAGADVAALGMLSWLWAHAARVPEDLAVVGCDDIPAAGLEPISLTTVDQQADRMGRLAVELLVERLTGRTASRHLLVAPELRVRRSA